MPDLALRNTNDGGEIEIVNGVETMSDGVYEYAYLCMFGGNEADDGSPSTVRKQWWGNLGEVLPERTYRSKTQNVMRAMPATSGNLKKVQDAAMSDLSTMVDTGFASQVSAVASIPKLNHIELTISITVKDKTFTYVIAKSWGVAA